MVSRYFSSSHDKNIPSAAVLSVPKGRFLPDTGSQTSISPSSIMLGDCSFRGTTEKKQREPINSLVEGCIDVWRKAANPNMAPVQIAVVLSFSYSRSDK
jgi:hypothetical protein